jgi:oligoendopeptidase F
MSQPTWEDFQRLENELKEEVRKLREQITEPMKPINVNVASADVISRLDGIQQYFSRELKTVSDTWLDTLQEHYTEHKQDISGAQTVLKGHTKFFEEHGRRLGQIESTMATKDDISELKDLILQLIQQRPKE